MKRLIPIAALGLALTGCERTPPADDPAPSPTPTPQIAATQSIFSPEAGVTPVPQPLEPLRTTVTFEDGAELSQAAMAELATVLESRQVEAGGAIVLGGHTDSGGSDAVNLRASQARAEAVRDWLVEQGVDAARITVIAFGEQNPARPNALPDGSPNEAGRAANRRVEILVEVDRESDAEDEAPPSEEAE